MNWTYKKVLVAGGAGMIGSHLSTELVKRGATVTIADNLSSGSVNNINHLLKEAEFVNCDLRERQNCIRATKGKDAIFQLSATMGGMAMISTVHADIMHDNGLLNTNMLRAALKAEVPHYFYSSSACFPSDAEVITNPSFKKISNVKVGDKVLSGDGEYHLVKEVGNRPYVGDLISFMSAGCNIRCTPNHPILIDDAGVTSWKPAVELRDGDYVVIAKPTVSSTNFPKSLPFLEDKFVRQNRVYRFLMGLGRKITWSESIDIAREYGVSRTLAYYYSHKFEFKRPSGRVCYFKARFIDVMETVDVDARLAEVLGIFLAEGWSEKGSVVFAFSDDEKEYSDRCQSLMESIFGIKGRRQQMRRQKGFKIEFDSVHLARFFKRIAYDDSGLYRAANKKIPKWAFDIPIEWQKLIIKGYWLGDGGCNNCGSKRVRVISCSTVSDNLMWQLRTILLRLNILSSVYHPKPTSNVMGRKVNCHQPHQLYIRGKRSQDRLLELVGKSLYHVNRTQDRYREYDNYFAVPIQKVNKSKWSGTVYNLEVEGSHTYCVQNVVVHNCIYPVTKQTSPDVVPLKEDDAYPAMPNESYGWEKLYSEQLALAYQQDYGMNIRIGRFHNIYGTGVTCFHAKKGKAPCHLILKAIKHPNPLFEIWGSGEATRSFCHFSDCIEMVLRLMDSDFTGPINIGSDRLVTINQLAQLVIDISGKKIVPLHVDGPVGVMGRNAELSLMRYVLKYEPKVSLEEGLRETYEWAQEHYKELEGI